MKGIREEKSCCFSYFSDGTPVPDVLTEKEAVKFLRLDDGETKYPSKSLEYYRNQGILRGTRVGKRLRYLKSELLNFLENQTRITNGEMS
ncbi:hypothetical protein SMSP2_01528 [Limihaloglobus sulfuriphilus]|uniref:Helix-turn-helix domain protein n=1 Tax=Limihaloglobus sulfuriphilus TaxID=1851148 RepID=A0A1Q2MFX3_9BACT|nr:helix-turn-helix domain-containing protein [Limihaloglobus sulfuriphilus]AQQ71162.1 hypothetical protein SMSP2_01528 [Limihaloglobus sulfuriphilus]